MAKKEATAEKPSTSTTVDSAVAKKKPVKKVAKEPAPAAEATAEESKPEVKIPAEVVEKSEVKSTTKAGKRSTKAQKEAEEKAAKEVRKQSPEKAEAPKEVKNPARTKAERAGKKYREAAAKIDPAKNYSLAEALKLATETNPAKFDATVELHVRLGVDPKQADQNIRDLVSLPAGTGKTVRVAVADDALLAKLDKEEIDFDILIATPDFMPKLGKYARLLGPRGLMPSPKSGTVTANVEAAMEQAKAGRVEYRVDPSGIVHVGIGKVSFGPDKLLTNAQAIMDSLRQNKPASLKGIYIKSITVSSTMGPGIKVEA